MINLLQTIDTITSALNDKIPFNERFENLTAELHSNYDPHSREIYTESESQTEQEESEDEEEEESVPVSQEISDSNDRDYTPSEALESEEVKGTSRSLYSESDEETINEGGRSAHSEQSESEPEGQSDLTPLRNDQKDLEGGSENLTPLDPSAESQEFEDSKIDTADEGEYEESNEGEESESDYASEEKDEYSSHTESDIIAARQYGMEEDMPSYLNEPEPNTLLFSNQKPMRHK